MIICLSNILLIVHSILHIYATTVYIFYATKTYSRTVLKTFIRSKACYLDNKTINSASFVTQHEIILF